MKVDLVYTGNENGQHPRWSHGEVRVLPAHIPNAMIVIDVLINQSAADYTLIWDFTLGAPDEQLIEKLTQRTIDVWHAGLRLGLQSKPELLQHIYPTWMYNYDVNSGIESTSFRLSFTSCLFRNEVWKKAGGGDGSFSTWDMIGLDLGYRWIKSGALIRYLPDLVKASEVQNKSIPLEDEFKFIRKNFPRKWNWWTLFRRMKLNPATAIKAYWKTRHVAQQPLEETGFNPRPHTERNPASVSVLIPTLHRYAYLLNELEQLKRQTVKPLEVLITDQTDKDFRQSDFLDKFPELDIKYFPQDSKGQCIAWNKLLSEAKGDYVLFLGDDADRIYLDFIADLVSDLNYYQADMSAAHVEEVGIANKLNAGNIRIADGFPICLVRRELLLRTGFMDMAFNRDIRADHDLAMRCHQQGALMILDYGCKILHHRAPSGGLREHRARVHTWHKSKNSLTLLLLPTNSEVYLIQKYYTESQVQEELAIRKLSLFFIHGGMLRRCLRFILVIFRYPMINMRLRKMKMTALKNLKSSNL